MPCDVGWTHLYTVCSHVLDTVARPFFSICLLWRHNPSFLLKQECRPAPGPLHTTKSWNGQIRQSDGCSSTLSSAYLWSLSINSSHSTTHHACLTARRENVFRLFCFFGALLLECMQMQEKSSDVVHQWEIGTDISCLIVKVCNSLISSWPKRVRAVTLKNNLINWLKYLFKIPLLCPFNKDV